MNVVFVFCLDSDILIDFLKNKPAAVSKFKELSNDGKLATTSLNLAELFHGVYRSKATFEAQYSALKGFENQLEVLGFEAQEAELAGKLSAFLSLKGEEIGAFDTLIAAICVLNRAKLVTRNSRHFEKIPGLQVEKW